MSAAKEESRCLLPKAASKFSSSLMATAKNTNGMTRSSDLYCTSSSPSNEENNDESDFLESDDSNGHLRKSSSANSKHVRIPLVKNRRLSRTTRHRYHIHWGERRLARLMFCIMLMSMILIMFYYLPLYTTIQTRQVALSDWSQNTSRNIAEYIHPDNDTNLFEPRSTCQTPDKFFLLIAVASGLHNFAIRQTIRETWGNATEFNYGMFLQLHAHLKGQYLEPIEQRLRLYREYIGLSSIQTINNGTIIPLRVVFFVGRSKPTAVFDDETSMTAMRIRNESERYQDIVQEDFIDTYNNLTLKSVMILKWATRRCLENCAFIMKCDDDTFVNVPNLLHYLLGGTIPLYSDTLDLYNARTYKVLSSSNRLSKIRNYLAGYLFCSYRPISNLSSKWYMPYYMYPDEKYPEYISGSAYVMSIDVVQQLFEASLNTTFIYLEDVYLTGIVSDKLKLQRTHQPLFSHKRKKELCSLKGSITQHEMKGDSLSEAYAFVTNLTYQCPPPGRFFKHIPLLKNGDCG